MCKIYTLLFQLVSNSQSPTLDSDSYQSRHPLIQPDALTLSAIATLVFHSTVIFVSTSISQHSRMASVRNLKIKTGTCKRLIKELHSYEKEVEREAAKTADMKEKGADPYDLKQQENVLAESRMMVPDCRKRLESALADLKGTLAELEESNEQGPELDEAQSAIADVEKLFQNGDA